MDWVKDWLKYLGFALFGLGLFDIGSRHVFGPPGIFYPRFSEYGDYRNILVSVYPLGEGFPPIREPWVNYLV